MIELTFKPKKETDNTVAFAEVLPRGRKRGVVGTLYVLKDELAKMGNPSELTITIKGV